MDFFKVLLHIFNVVFTLAGLVMISIGIWTAADKIFISSIVGDTLFSSASYLAIVVGVITVCVSILGIYAVAKEHLKLLYFFFVCLILAAVMMLIGGILAVVFKNEIEETMVGEMRKTLINGYGGDADVTDAWDKVQADMSCCAISETVLDGGSSYYSGAYADGTQVPVSEQQYQDSWPMYKRTEWFRRQMDQPDDEKKFVPKSCCVYKSGDYTNLGSCQNFASGPPNTYVNMLTNYYLYADGCYDKAKSLMMDHADILIALGFVFAFIMLGGIIVTFLVVRRIRADQNEDIKRRREPDNL